jgi:hypothetical protein
LNLAISKVKEDKKTYQTQTNGIDKVELERLKATGECQHCAWPGDSNGSHETLNCFRWKRLETEIAPFPKAKLYQQIKG